MSANISVKMFLRVASMVALLEVLGHTFLFVSYVPSHGPVEVAVVDAMKLHRFSFGGSTHSYWELYSGYGFFVSVSCLVQAGVLWQIGGLMESGISGARSIVALFLLGEVGYVYLMWTHFFIIPVVSHITLALCLAAALLLATGRRSALREIF